jgi:hypothetical protein
MKTCSILLLAAFSLALMLAATHTAFAADETKIKANLAKLSPEDRKLAESQKWCAVEPENELGSMGKPVKVVLKGESVFLCCKACVRSANKNPDETIQKAKELREKAASGK